MVARWLVNMKDAAEYLCNLHYRSAEEQLYEVFIYANHWIVAVETEFEDDKDWRITDFAANEHMHCDNRTDNEDLDKGQ